MPGALGILYLVALYWLTPQAYYYMVKVPALYDVHIGWFIWMTWRFLAAAACLWLALGTVLLAPRSLGHEWLRRVVWVGTAFIVTLPLSGISAAKFGGDNNSVIPARLSMTILIWLLLAPKFACFDRSASSKTKREMLGVLVAASFTLTVMPTLELPRGYTESWGRENAAYQEAISVVSGLSGSILSYEDPTITLLSKKQANRSIYSEYDVLGWKFDDWPPKIPSFIATELRNADYIVDKKIWSLSAEGPIHESQLSALGFQMEWANRNYSVWRNGRNPGFDHR